MNVFIETLKPVLIFGGAIFLLFFIPLWILGKTMGKRTKEMQNEARKRGFTFTLSGDGSFLESLKDFFLMNFVDTGYSQERNLLKKQENSTEITLVDLYLRSSEYRTKDKTTTSPTVLCFKSNNLDLPEFYMKPEQMLDKVASKFGYKDIDFSEHPEFSKAYLLYGKDEVAVRNLFNKSGIINLFEREKGFCIEGKGQYLVIYKRVRGVPCSVATAELNAFINKGQQIFSMFSK